MKYEKYQNYVGEKHGNLTITKFIGIEKNIAMVETKCFCGLKEKVNLSSILNGYKLSCKNCGNRKIVPIGTKFDMLEVVNIYIDEETKFTYVDCRCECGNMKNKIRIHNLTKSKRKEDYVHSCGCFYKKNLIGNVYGKLTVIKEAETAIKTYNGRKVTRRRWVCDCECGTRGKVVNQNELESDETKSCGCLLSTANRRERVKGEKNPMYGIRGELHPNWDPERTHEQREIERKTNEYYLWRMAVYERDHFMCKCCGKKSTGDIIAHHIFNYKDFPDRRYDVSNGITLCTSCHDSYHIIYGKQNNTSSEFEEYINKYFPRDKVVTLDEIIKNKEISVRNVERVKPYCVLFPNGSKEYYFTYDEIKEKAGIPITATLNSVKNGVDYKVRKIVLKKDGKNVLEFPSYSQAAKFFGCSIEPISKRVNDSKYRSVQYPELNNYDFEEIIESYKIERINKEE